MVSQLLPAYAPKIPEPSSFEEAQKRIDEISKELANWRGGSKSETIIELRRLCGRHHTVPKSYKLEGVVKRGECAQSNSQVTEIWKGVHNDKVVALKILKVPRDDPQIQRAKSRFCKEVVLMKQLKHNNILPLRGVSATVSEFCLVFPWCDNGQIMDYLKKMPDANRFDLLLGAASGLRYLHDNRLVHGALRPSHVLVNKKGTARLASAGRSSIVAVKDTSVAAHVQSAGEIDNNYRYLAPEIQSPESYGMDKILISKESDVYGIGMIAYEVLTGKMPYFGSSDASAFQKTQAGETPRQPFDVIDDAVWEFLKKCWSRDPTERPSIVEVCNAFSGFRSLPQVIPTPGLVTEELPKKLKLQVQSIKLSLGISKQRVFFIKFQYGNNSHETSRTYPMDGSGEYKWHDPESRFIETDNQQHGQSVFLELFRQKKRGPGVKVCAKGKFTLLNNVNKQASVDLKAPGSTGSAVLKIYLMGL